MIKDYNSYNLRIENLRRLSGFPRWLEWFGNSIDIVTQTENEQFGIGEVTFTSTWKPVM